MLVFLPLRTKFSFRSIFTTLSIILFLSVSSLPVFAAPTSSPSSDPPSAPASGSSTKAPSAAESWNALDEASFDENYGHFGLSLAFLFNIAQTPSSHLFYENGFGGIGEISYGVLTGLRIIAGGGYVLNSPHFSPPLKGVGNNADASYEQGYIGGRLAMNPFFPSFFIHQPWIPYIRSDVGGVSAGVSDAGALSGHQDGVMADLGVGIEGRAPELPIGFFVEVRSQWFFLGPQTETVVPILVGSTFYF
ncbi:MAG: hypothetical protein ACYCT9_01100 [Leptospirillum sp.]|jgi:hypothetical protein